MLYGENSKPSVDGASLVIARLGQAEWVSGELPVIGRCLCDAECLICTHDFSRLRDARWIYRAGSNTPRNFTPRATDVRGLSAFTSLKALGSNVQKVQIIDTTRLSSLIVTPDVTPKYHVSIAPPDHAQIRGWAATRETDVVHELTWELGSAVVGEMRMRHARRDADRARGAAAYRSDP